MTFKKYREWVEDENHEDVELDEVDGHAHEYRPHSGRYQDVKGERIFVWETDLCRRCHKKRPRPKTHKNKTKTVTIEASLPVFKKEEIKESAVLVNVETGEISEVPIEVSTDDSKLSVGPTDEEINN
jgi:hypothetical protein